MINFFRKKEKEPFVDGMTFSFRIRPKVKGFGYEDEVAFFEDTGMSRYFSKLIQKVNQEENHTLLTIRLLQSKFEAKIDDPILKKLRNQYVEQVNEILKVNNFSCDLEESGIMVDIDNELSTAIFFDENGNHILHSGKQMEYTKNFLAKQQDKAAYYEKGIELLNLWKYDEAIECFNKALKIEPADHNILNLKGAALMNLERAKEAIECFDKALEIDPNIENILNNKGLALSDIGKHDEAIQCYDKAVEINPNYEKAYYNKGLELDLLGKLDDALKLYDKAVELKPNYEKALIRKGLTQIRINLSSKKTLSPPKISIEIICPRCEKSTKLIYIDDYVVDKKNPLDEWALNNTDDMVYPEMNKAMYDVIKNQSSDNTTIFFSIIAKVESHMSDSSKKDCSTSNKTYKVFYYFFVKQENQTAGFTFRLVEEIPENS